MDKDKLKEKREELLTRKGEAPKTYFSILFKSGYEKTFTPGQKYIETNTREEIIQSFRDLADSEWELFKRRFGFGLEEIEAIGIDKYIDALGWTNRFQVGTWKSDKYHALICPHCKNNFGMWELSAALCDDCKPHYLYSLIDAADMPLPADNKPEMDSRVIFLTDKNYRDLFKKDPNVSFEDHIMNDDSPLTKRLIVNKILGDLTYTAIAMENDVDNGLARLRYFPVEKIKPVVDGCMIADRVKIGNPKFQNHFKDKVDYFYKLLEDFKIMSGHFYNIYTFMFENAVEIARLQNEMTKDKP